MLFNSVDFIFLFLPSCILAYYCLLRTLGTRPANLSLLISSFTFYSWIDHYLLYLLLFSIATNYFFGSVLTSAIRFRKCILFISVASNIFLLSYFKYYNFIVLNLNIFSGTNINLLDIALPLAISFFTFQQIAYQVDIYKRKILPTNILDYALFVSFFPQLIAGPIVHFRELNKQISFSEEKPRKPSIELIRMGVILFIIGLFKKLVIADYFAFYANTGFSLDNSLTFFSAWGTTLAFALQIYFDFSAYCEMAIGLGLLFGVKLPVNFNSPYKAKNIQEFWTRWHITLSSFLRDYIYIPLGGGRDGAYKTARNVLVTFLLGGLWHGASWMFVLWGLVHAIGIVTFRAWTRIGFKLNQFTSWIITFFFILISWVLFRAPDIATALNVYSNMLDFSSLSKEMSIELLRSNFDKIIAYSAAILLIFSPNILQVVGYIPYNGKIKMKNTLLTAVIISFLAVISILNLFSFEAETEFLYFKF